jgi:hypothetical protein
MVQINFRDSEKMSFCGSKVNQIYGRMKYKVTSRATTLSKSNSLALRGALSEVGKLIPFSLFALYTKLQGEQLQIEYHESCQLP